MTRSVRASFVLACLLTAARVEAQGPPLTLPESSQAASVTQRIVPGASSASDRAGR